MANKTLFASVKKRTPRTRVRNEAGGRAYELEPRQTLAQLAATGCFSGAYYTSAERQLDELRTLIAAVDDNVFLAKLAVYARQRAYMKDMPAALLVVLSTRDTALMHQVFDRVVDNGRVLRTLFTMVRSGQFGRTGLSSSLRRAFRNWLNQASVGQLLSASIGKDPSLRDVLRMARPTPPDNERRALYGWLTGKDVPKWAPAAPADLPRQVQQLMAFRSATSSAAQVEILRDLSVRWDLLADAALGPAVWRAIAQQMGPQALRMNLNTLVRHDVIGRGAGQQTASTEVAERLADENAIRRSRQFPYQFLAAYLNSGSGVPQQIKRALHRAAEYACGNVPVLPGPVVIGVDVSASMQWPVTGVSRRGGSSKMRCVDVAALFAAAIARRNPESVIVPFDTSAYRPNIDPSDSILSLAQRLAQFGGGGTDCSLPLVEANSTLSQRAFAGCVLVSDNESWVGAGRGRATKVMTEWERFAKNQRRQGVEQPKLVCIDVQPYRTTQAPERDDILNIAGFSDAVFNVVSAFLDGDAARFVAEVEAIEL